MVRVIVEYRIYRGITLKKFTALFVLKANFKGQLRHILTIHERWLSTPRQSAPARSSTSG